MTSERRWGVSNAGQRDNPVYTASIARQFTNTLDSQLFQTARISAGSLRYYGLGFFWQNGQSIEGQCETGFLGKKFCKHGISSTVTSGLCHVK